MIQHRRSDRRKPTWPPAPEADARAATATGIDAQGQMVGPKTASVLNMAQLARPTPPDRRSRHLSGTYPVPPAAFNAHSGRGRGAG
jgi:hypothetical protein